MGGSTVAVHGSCEPGYEAVADAFRANFTDHGDIGAAVCVYHRGRPVVDLWGGDADRDAGGRAVQQPHAQGILQLLDAAALARR